MLKVSGKAYLNNHGVARPSRQMRPACLSCRKNCSDKFTEEQRRLLFDEYYAVDTVVGQWEYLSQRIDTTVPKSQYQSPKFKMKQKLESSADKKKRNNNIIFYLYKNEERVRVCKEMFMATFDISHSTVSTAKNKSMNDNLLIKKDLRGSFMRKK